MRSAQDAPEANVNLGVGKAVVGKPVRRAKQSCEVPQLLNGFDLECHITEVPRPGIVGWRRVREDSSTKVISVMSRR